MTGKPAKFRSHYRAPEFQITTVDLTFDLDDQSTQVRNSMHVVPTGTSTTLCLQGEKLELVEVILNGQVLAPTSYLVDADSLTLEVPPTAFDLTLITIVNPSANQALEGLYKSKGVFCTQCEAEGFRRISYYLDRPDVLAEFTTTIIADQQSYPYLLSNGNMVDHGKKSNGRHWVTWHDPYPKPAYLFALVAGDFDLLNDNFVTRSGRDVQLQLFVDKGHLDRAEFAMQSLKNAMRWDEERFDLEYDLDIYMIVAVDFFNMGAMENKGLNIFNSKYVLANPKTATDQDYLNIESVIGHEYFHNWTGNRITCRDWFQLSLKEGLTVFRDQEFSSDLGSRAVNRIDAIKVIRTHQFNEDASPMAHSIRPDKVVEMNNFYTVTVYNKGAEVIRMLHTLLGEAGFQAGMKLYIERHDAQAVTCDDFVNAMADGNQRNLDQFKRWYSQVGTPIIEVKQHYDAASKQLSLFISQQPGMINGAESDACLHLPILLSAYNAQGEQIQLKHHQLLQHQSGSYLLELTEANLELRFDAIEQAPVLALLENFSAPAKLVFEQSFAQLITLAAHAEQEVTRWEALQQVYLKLLLDAVQGQQIVKLPENLVTALDKILGSDLDLSLKTLLFTPPSIEECAEFFSENMPIDALANAHQQLRQSLAKSLYEPLQQAWQQRAHRSYQLSGEAIAERSWAHLVLYYLALANPENYNSVVADYYDSADNMTAQQSALQLAVHLDLPCKARLLESFEQQWQEQSLVLDKWFAIQASSPQKHIATTVKALLEHPKFDLGNPNRVYALLATFSRNLVAFHREDGAGYALLGEVINTLNATNPQVAARLVTPFTQWRRYDSTRQKQLKDVLISLQKLPELAPDLDEKISNSLD